MHLNSQNEMGTSTLVEGLCLDSSTNSAPMGTCRKSEWVCEDAGTWGDEVVGVSVSSLLTASLFPMR